VTEQYANGARTTVASPVGSGDGTVSVASATGFPTSGNFRLLVCRADLTNAELMLVTSVAGTTFTVSRAAEPYGGAQSAVSHASGEVAAHVLTVASLPTGGAAPPAVTAAALLYAYQNMR